MVDGDYFEDVIVTVKALSGTIQRETEKLYPHRQVLEGVIWPIAA